MPQAWSPPAAAPGPRTEYFGGTQGAPKATPEKSQSIRYDNRHGFDLAFVDADVAGVIDAVMGTMLRLSYRIDPGVDGKLTLRSARPVAKESLLPLLESALASVDAVILRQGSTYVVAPRAEARAKAPVVDAGGTAAAQPGYATEVVTLRHAGVRELTKLLERMLGKDTVVSSDPAYNQIIIAGSGSERQAARALIRRLDVDWMAGMSFALYRLDNVDADTLMADLERIFQPPLDLLGSRVRLVPLPRLRSVLGIAADRADLVRLDPWIRRLDASGASGKRTLYNYAVQNGRARDLANSLQQVLALDGAMADGGSGSAGAVTTATSAAAGDNGAGARTSTPAAQSISPAGSGTTGPRIVPNEENNSLLIYATAEDYQFIRDALDKLDRPVAQVLIEATLAEVTLTKDLKFGLEWAIDSGRSSFTSSNNSSGVPSPSFPGFSYIYAATSARAVLNTLQSRTNVRVLSAPKLIVLNNQPATLQVGDQVPIVTQQAQSTSAAGAPIINTVEMRDTGVILKVTPRVNDSGTIILDVAQEVSDVIQTTTSGINSPTIQQRRLSSTVATRSGQMIALGGLIRDRMSKEKTGIPLLSQIPVLGAAFGRQGDTGSRTELIILITPTVMKSPEETKAVVDELIDRLDETKPLVTRAVERQVGGQAPH